MDSLTDRIRRSLAQRGMVGTVKMCAESLRWRVVPSLRRAEMARRAADEAFDRDYGVDTGGIFRSKEDEVVGKNWALGGNYQAVDPPAFLEVLNDVPIPHAEFTFIDFGSGKGRAVLLASTFPFRKAIGVEYCAELNRIARANVLRFPISARRCADVEVVDADAAEYALPDAPLLLFLYHPFAEPVMAKVVNNVADSIRKSPRRIVVVYLLPHFDHLWEATGIFKRTQSTPAIFDTAK